MVHKAQKDGEVFSILKGQAKGQVGESQKKLTRKQKIAKKEAAHEALRAEIEAQRLVPEEKPVLFDD